MNTQRIFYGLLVCAYLGMLSGRVHAQGNDLLRNLRDPHVCAFLDLIAYAEGTLGVDQYRTLYGKGKFDCYKDHPRKVVKADLKGRTWHSSAAGKYQILQKTWDSLCGKHEIGDFSPRNQDKAALALLDEVGALALIREGRVGEALGKVKHIWASLPGSMHMQPTKKTTELKQVYNRLLGYHEKRLNRLVRGARRVPAQG